MTPRAPIAALLLFSICCFYSISGVARQRAPSLKVDVDLVVVSITVLDRNSRYVGSLPRTSFHLWEDKVEQTIAEFSVEDAPMSLGILLDTSQSMSSGLPIASRNAGECLELGTKSDEYFLMLFSENVYTLTEFTSELARLQSRLRYIKSSGNTSLHDALYAGIATLKHGANPRKAMVVVTDGYENSSRQPGWKVREAVRESDLQIYSIGNTGSGLLNELSEISGGRSLSGYTGKALQGICNEVVRELKSQYTIAYKSTNTARDGKWREIRVRVNPPPGLGRLTARSRTGYYAPVP
jgi:Ca-activated chloride channel family protein